MSAAAVAPVRANATQFPGFSPRFRVVSSGMGGAFTSAMTSSTRRLVAASCVTAVVVAMATGCGGPPKVRSAAGERLPANGAASAVPASTLPSKTIAREGTRTADARNLEGAGKIIGTWTEFSTQKGKSSTADGKKVGAGPEPTRKVDSVGLTCAQGRSTIQVNGVQYPFDIAWVVAGEGTGPTVSGNEGAGQFAMIQALSFKDKRVVFAKVFVPSDANNDTDDTVIVSSLEGYLPDDADEPIVRAVSERGNPKLETFVRAKGAEEGISFQVPQQDALGSARYLSVARFDVARQ
jgi:hypothetical protein